MRRFRIRTISRIAGAVCAALAVVLVAPMNAHGAGGQAPFVVDARAPELVGGPWLNTPKGEPIKLVTRKGKVTVVEFWTYG